MKVIDIIFALICGRIVAWLAHDFLIGYGIEIGYYKYLLYYALPVIFLAFLWTASLIGKKILFIFQLAKHILVGMFATVIDLKAFELLIWFFSISLATVNPIISKGISFLISTSFKYLGNKNWTFEKPEKEGLGQEIFKFIIVVIIGLGIDVSSFFYFTKIMGPQFGASEDVWVKSSVIFAALIAAVWNFTGEKFIVFKK